MLDVVDCYSLYLFTVSLAVLAKVSIPTKYLFALMPPSSCAVIEAAHRL